MQINKVLSSINCSRLLELRSLSHFSNIQIKVSSCSKNLDRGHCLVAVSRVFSDFTMANSSSANLRFADYSVILGSVPAKFDIPPEIILLSNSVVPTHSFKLEQEVQLIMHKMQDDCLHYASFL